MSVLEAIFCAILLVKLELPAFRPWFELQIRAHDPFAVRSPRWASVAAHYVSRVGLCFGCGEIILTKRTVDLDLIRSPLSYALLLFFQDTESNTSWLKIALC